MTGRTSDPFITITEAAALIGISRPTVEKRVAEGRLRGKMIAGKLVIYRASAQSYREYLESDAA